MILARDPENERTSCRKYTYQQIYWEIIEYINIIIEDESNVFIDNIKNIKDVGDVLYACQQTMDQSNKN